MYLYFSFSKIVCCLQVREVAITTLVDVYRHVGERVRADLAKRGLPAARWVIAGTVEHYFVHVGLLVCLCMCTGTYTFCTAGDSLLKSLPITGTPIQSTMLMGRGGGRRKVQIAHKDIGVGGVKWFKESVRSRLLKRISNRWFHPFLVVPVASIVCWLLRMSLVSVNAGWGCVSCVVHIKACLFTFRHMVYLSRIIIPVSICPIDVLYGQMQWFKSKTQYMSSPLYIFTGNIWSTDMSAGLLVPRWNVGLSAESFWLDHISKKCWVGIR